MLARPSAPRVRAPFGAICLLVLAVLVLPAASADDTPSLLGFSTDGARRQVELEARFDAQLDAAEIGSWIEQLSARPHHVGSAYGKENAEAMLAMFRSWGWEAEIEEYQVLFPTPKVRLLELVAPHSWRAGLEEPALAEDRTSAQKDEQLPSYNAYSVDGDVTAELVYVNRGVPKDYEELEKRGISVEGKIVIARYYGSWRGIKPKVAAEKGAIGCIIYTDPSDDGYAQGDVYPEGGWRSADSVQRGSVADMPLFPGDPLTPGVAAKDGAERLALDDAPTLTKIPVLPISYADAQPLLAALGGPVAPGDWRGDLPLAYHLGPGPARVHLKLEFDWSLRPAYNVVARLEGGKYPDQWIVRGNHHDAWVNGATDPISGMAVVLAEAQAIGALVKGGWRPDRTLVYAGWDAEEPGLLGSTEWVEDHADELRAKAVAYINTDSNERGLFGVEGSHVLEPLINQVMRDVDDPETDVTVRQRLAAAMTLSAPPPVVERVRAGGDLPIGALGSGSDYSPFVQHLGIASLSLGFGSEGDYGQYHSIYDSFDHYRRFMDPDFRYGVALAQVVGRTALRLAQAEVLPMRPDSTVSTVAGYVDEIDELVTTVRDETAEENRRIRDGIYAMAWDPEDQWQVPAEKEPVPYLELSVLRNALAALQRSAEAFAKAWTESAADLSADQAARLDQVLLTSERALTRDAGLPRRPWYVHHLYAPGFYTGYGVKTLPGVREAIENRNWQEADEQIHVLAEVLAAYAAKIDQASDVLGTPRE